MYDPIPSTIREQLNLMPWLPAVRALHFPESAEALEQARTRMAFQELLLLQLMLLLRREINRCGTAGEQMSSAAFCAT